MLSPEPTERDLKWLEEDYCADIRVMGLIEHYRALTARLGRCENNLIDEQCRSTNLTARLAEAEALCHRAKDQKIYELMKRCARLDTALGNIQGSYYLLCCQEIDAAAFDAVMMEEMPAIPPREDLLQQIDSLRAKLTESEERGKKLERENDDLRRRRSDDLRAMPPRTA